MYPLIDAECPVINTVCPYQQAATHPQRAVFFRKMDPHWALVQAVGQVRCRRRLCDLTR